MNEEEPHENEPPYDPVMESADTAVSIARDDNPTGRAKLPTLDEIGRLYGTDKASTFHCYLERYEPYFEPRRFQSLRLLEIGIAGGASIRTWRHYFPKATIMAVDHNKEFCEALEKAGLDRVFVYNADAEDAGFWSALRAAFGRNFDIIIDDASHYSSQVIATFREAWPLVAPGGLYIIEDTHSAYIHPYKGNYTTIDCIRDMIDLMNEHGDKECGKSSDKTAISFIHLSKSLAIIGKRQ